MPELFDAILTEYKLACRFFHLEHAGQVLVWGAKEKGDVRTGDALQQAYDLGVSIAEPSLNLAKARGLCYTKK